MRLVILAALVLSACSAGISHPLTHVDASAPIWVINPDKWSPPGGNELTQPPTVPSGRIPLQASN